MKKIPEKYQTTIIIILTIIFAILLLWFNTYQRCKEQYSKAEEYFKKGDWMNAIVYYETAIHAYTPYNSMIKNSAERLWEISQILKQKKDYKMALIALRSLRSSFYAVRSLYTPYKFWIKKAEDEIENILRITEKNKQLKKIDKTAANNKSTENKQ